MQIKKPKLELVDDAKDCKHWWSLRLTVLSSTATAAWALTPPDLKSWLPPELRPFLAISMFALIFVATLFKQDINRGADK